MKINQKGFGAIETILIVVIVGIIGGVGWFVYNSQKKTNDTLNKTAQSQGDPQKAEQKNATSYLEIKEWGVKIKQPASAISYKLDNIDSNGSQAALLTNADAAALKDFSSSCNFAVLERVKELPSAAVFDQSQAKKIGDYYYYPAGAQTPCSSDKNEETVKKVLLDAAQTVEKL